MPSGQPPNRAFHPTFKQGACDSHLGEIDVADIRSKDDVLHQLAYRRIVVDSITGRMSRVQGDENSRLLTESESGWTLIIKPLEVVLCGAIPNSQAVINVRQEHD